MKFLYIFFLFFLKIKFSYSIPIANIEILEDSSGFNLTYNGVMLLKHSRSIPLMSVGHGQFEAEEHLGNFELTDLIDAKYELTEWVIDVQDEVVRIELSSTEVSEVGVCLIATETEEDQFELRLDYDAFDYTNINRFILRLPSTLDERVWGGGEQYTFLNLRKGGVYPIWVREQGVGRNKSSLLTQLMDLDGAGGDYHTSYWPQPSFLSSNGYHFEMTMQTYSELNLAPIDDHLGLLGHSILWHQSPVAGVPCPDCKFIFTVKQTLMEIVQAINPGQPVLPDWVHQGAIIGVQGGTDRMLQVLNEARDSGVAVSAMWIQDWSGKIVTLFGKRVFWNWIWNQEWYPNLDTVIESLKEEGIRVTAYINPYLNVKGDIYEANRNIENWLTDQHDETLIQDFGQFNAATIDIIKPESEDVNNARNWYKNLMKKNLVEFGFAGWMADFGEYTPINARTNASNEWWGNDHGEILHQTLSEHWTSLNREVIEESGNLGELLVWHRSGGTRSRQYITMSWAGDQAVDWTASDGLKSSITAALSLAVSGTGLSHSDIGGYTTAFQLGLTRSKELLLRWSEYSVFTPVMRTHEGNQPDKNHQVYTDSDTFKKFGRLTQIFASLANYTKMAVAQNAYEGKPVMRPLFLDFEDDKKTFDIEYEFMFGDDLLVAPVTEPDVTQWTLYLPGNDQNWIWFWDTNTEPEVFHGGSDVTVQAPLGKPPVFYREDSEWSSLFRSVAFKYEKIF